MTQQSIEDVFALELFEFVRPFAAHGIVLDARFREAARDIIAFARRTIPSAPTDDVERVVKALRKAMSSDNDDTIEGMARAALAAMPSARSDADRQDDAPPLTFTYRNHRGEVSERRVKPLGIRHGSTEWHPEPQWLLRAYDLDKQAEREFAMADIGDGRLSGLREAAEIAKTKAVEFALYVEEDRSAEPQRALFNSGRQDGAAHVRQVILDRAAASQPPVAGQEGDGSFQIRVRPWLLACFGEAISGDREERNHRFLEEALELVQACGCTAHEAHQLVDYTFGRPAGQPPQECGGVMVTLAALCLANGLDMHDAGEIELARIWTCVEKIRAKHAAKPKHSPLPEVPAPESRR